MYKHFKLLQNKRKGITEACRRYTARFALQSLNSLLISIRDRSQPVLCIQVAYNVYLQGGMCIDCS